ncbi:hypothetical protein [Pseudomonas cremoricolorata]|uniref:Uncharacterized protein n=1 Tax=Pseudomonas cremoricolorata TaxID=157783 RepID=A0A089WQ53_9PSED|nr:hypothetical protein [Pseudomonas cremoricolorata]AIR89279.1 hypothetical protein LK03_08310 [Pseudomonas cremoricolorata]
MGDSPLTTTEPEVYERLIDRLGLALETARTAVRLRDETPTELELRGLSPAEFELIRTWLETQALGRLAQAGRDNRAPVATARVIWLKDRKRPARAPATRTQTFR